jgi:uncharacterized protein
VQLSLDNNNGVFVRSFANGELHVNNEILTGPVILTLQDIIPDWAPPPIAELCMADFSAALKFEPEVILFGTGATQAFPPATLFTDIMRAGVGFEVMDTAAASRTFNVLSADGRRVVAALII